MEADEIAELRTLYIFTPAEGDTWGLSYDALERTLRDRDPDEFIRIEEPGDGPADHGSTMHFGITLDDEVLEGMAKVDPEGIAISDCTAPLAAGFVTWLRENVVPHGKTLTFNTRWGMEEELPDEVIPEAAEEEVRVQFARHLQATL